MTWVDPSGHNALAGTEFTGPMVAAAAMQIAYRSAALLTAAICSVRSCFAGTALLVFTVGVLVCFLDLGSACWTQAVYTAGLFAQYGSAAVAGAWTGSATAIRDAAQTFPDLPTVSEPSTDPAPRPREVPGLPQTGNGDDDECRIGANQAADDIAMYGLDAGPTRGLYGHLKSHQPPARNDLKGHFNRRTWQNLRQVLEQVLREGHAHRNLNPDGQADCEVTWSFPQPVGTDINNDETWTIAVYVDTYGHIYTAFPIPAIP